MFRYLSKSRIMSGLQCPKRLWLEANQPTLAEVDARTERSFAVGHSVGAIARTLWPDGHLVGHDHELNAAIAETRRVLAAHPDRPLFEGTFRHDGVLVRVDVLHGGDLIEVKAAPLEKQTRCHRFSCGCRRRGDVESQSGGATLRFHIDKT